MALTLIIHIGQQRFQYRTVIAWVYETITVYIGKLYGFLTFCY